MEMAFAPAVRTRRWGRVALTGPPGSGRLRTALTLAGGLADRFAVIDTQCAASEAYAINTDTGDGHQFDVLHLYRCSPDNLHTALATAVGERYPAIVVSSLTDFWSGPGGMLAAADQEITRNGGNTHAGWRAVRPAEQRAAEALLHYPGHVVVTMRSRVEWLPEDGDGGGRTLRRITKVEQREGIEDDFDTVCELNADTVTVTKAHGTALAGQIFSPDQGADLAKALHDWLADGAPGPDAYALIDQATDPDLTTEQARDLLTQCLRTRLSRTPMLHPSTPHPRPTSLHAYLTERAGASPAATA